MHAQLAITRERGWGANDGETPSAVRAVAAAIADPSGTARAAIVVIAPTNRLPLDDLPLVAEEVVASAKRVERSCSGAALVRAPRTLAVQRPDQTNSLGRSPRPSMCVIAAAGALGSRKTVTEGIAG